MSIIDYRFDRRRFVGSPNETVCIFRRVVNQHSIDGKVVEDLPMRRRKLEVVIANRELLIQKGIAYWDEFSKGKFHRDLQLLRKALEEWPADTPRPQAAA